MSLFKDGIMRKPDKASLRNVLLTKTSDTKDFESTVIDGGALLHRVHWPSNVCYKELLNLYVATVKKDYGLCHVVFDGYSCASVKDHEHSKRSGKCKSKDIMFSLDMKVTIKREDFLSNRNNKMSFIEKLSLMLEKDGQMVTLSLSDADTDIVKVAIEVSKYFIDFCFKYLFQEAKSHNTKVIADDTDIAVLLMYHWNMKMHDIILTSEISKKSWSIKMCCEDVSPEIKNILPFIHAFSGSDTTSALFGHGKPKLLKLMKGMYERNEIFYLSLYVIKSGNTSLINSAKSFMEVGAEPEELKANGVRIFLKIYGGNEKDTLRSLR